MTFLERMHAAIFNSASVFDSFENALLDILSENLNATNRAILASQRSRFNKIYRDYEKEKKKETSYFYWKYFGKSRIDFPDLFPVSRKERKLAKFTVTVPSGEVIDVSFWVVNGILFYIELHSEDELFRPLSPEFEVTDLEVYALGTK